MKFGWATPVHTRITSKVLAHLPLSNDEKVVICEASIEPDKYLPLNAMNHFQSPGGGGLAKSMIISKYKKGDLHSIGHALHYLQDINQPFHTDIKRPDLHYIFEQLTMDLHIPFQPDGRIHIFEYGLERGIDQIVEKSNSQVFYIERAFDDGDRGEFEFRAEEQLSLAAQSSYELLLLWMKKTGRLS